MTRTYEAPAIVVTADVAELTLNNKSETQEGATGLGEAGSIGFGL